MTSPSFYFTLHVLCHPGLDSYINVWCLHLKWTWEVFPLIIAFLHPFWERRVRKNLSMFCAGLPVSHEDNILSIFPPWEPSFYNWQEDQPISTFKILPPPFIKLKKLKQKIIFEFTFSKRHAYQATFHLYSSPTLSPHQVSPSYFDWQQHFMLYEGHWAFSELKAALKVLTESNLLLKFLMINEATEHAQYLGHTKRYKQTFFESFTNVFFVWF